MHLNWDINYATQIINYHDDWEHRLRIRTKRGGTWGSWYDILSEPTTERKFIRNSHPEDNWIELSWASDGLHVNVDGDTPIIIPRNN